MIAVGNVDVRQAMAPASRENLSLQASNPTNAELFHSLQIANSYADCIEREKSLRRM
jgi:hypothetical protein